MMDAGLSVGRRRAFIKRKMPFRGTLFDALFEDLMLLPKCEDLSVDGSEVELFVFRIIAHDKNVLSLSQSALQSPIV
jgi:hypothetical protein